jgi:ribosomal protein L35
MPKIKSHQATAKRFKRTAKNKLMKRKNGQDHFNARETGKTTRHKRLDIQMTGALAKTVRQLTPYNN